MLNPPFSFAAKDKGLKSLGRAIDILGPYQAGGAFVMRPWARANAPLLERYIAAYIESVRMTMDPANRAQVVSLIATRLKQDAKVAERTYQALMSRASDWRRTRNSTWRASRPCSRCARDRGQWGGKAPPPEKYVDLGITKGR